MDFCVVVCIFRISINYNMINFWNIVASCRSCCLIGYNLRNSSIQSILNAKLVLSHDVIAILILPCAGVSFQSNMFSLRVHPLFRYPFFECFSNTSCFSTLRVLVNSSRVCFLFSSETECTSTATFAFLRDFTGTDSYFSLQVLWIFYIFFFEIGKEINWWRNWVVRFGGKLIVLQEEETWTHR